MSEPFWRELIDQDKLEAQYEVLHKLGVYSDKQIAIHLARFAEAHIFNAADRRMERLKAAYVSKSKHQKLRDCLAAALWANRRLGRGIL